MFVLHVCRGQWSVSDVYIKMQSCALVDAMRYGLERYEVKIEREQGSGGKESAENAVKMLAGYRVEVIQPWTNKEGRATPLANRINIVGDVYYVEDTPSDPWNDPWLDELRKFPSGKYKDQVDASSGAYTSLCGTLVPRKPALISGLGKVDRMCKSPSCDRPAASDSDYCYACCEMTAAFNNDPTMPVDHSTDCNLRAHKYFNRR